MNSGPHEHNVLFGPTEPLASFFIQLRSMFHIEVTTVPIPPRSGIRISVFVGESHPFFRFRTAFTKVGIN